MADHPSGAILQRDGKTYAIVTRIPAGLVAPSDLERIAWTAKKYHIPVVKITSGLRIALVGIQKEDLDVIWQDLGQGIDEPAEPCVRYVQACLGTESCKYGVQDSLGLGKEIEERFRTFQGPAKLKMGVSGCLRCCAESYLRDIGIVGTNRGWTVIFGGNSGRRPRIGDIVARDLSKNDALDLVQRLLEYYRKNAQPKERTARFLGRIGLDMLKSELLILLPYISLEDATPE
jgi:NAD(P)H-nitrite reductase large subunit